MPVPTIERTHKSYSNPRSGAPSTEAPLDESRAPAWRMVLAGFAALLAAAPLAILIAWVNSGLESQPTRAVSTVALLCAALIPLPVAALWILKRREVQRSASRSPGAGLWTPAQLALVLLATILIVLTGIDLYWLGETIRFPADFLVWTESDFVNDILKLRAGYPLYSDQANNESFVYMPGTQLLTYAIASLLGNPLSIPTYRAIQLGYSVVASAIGALCVLRVLRLSAPALTITRPALWGAIWLPALFLLATNSVTNAYAVNLHNDGLAQLISLVAYWLLLEYTATRDRRILVAMALIPVVGLVVKQSLAIWAGLYGAYLLLFERPISWRRVISFGASAFGLVALALGAGYAFWGEHFTYWTVTVLGAHGVEPLRSVQHVLDTWVFFAAGIAAALVLLRGPALRVLIGPWLVWMTFLSIEAYTSGIAWMLNHMGPGTMIAGIWLLAAATRLWTERVEVPMPSGERWFRPALAVGVGVLLCSGMGLIRIPTRPFPTDAGRYVREIEKEFEGAPASNVLLDVGSWVYVPEGLIMKDRAPSIGERGFSETGDFSAMIKRIEEKRYAKILVRNFHSPDFWYDHEIWRKPSGIRAALQANYREVRTIAAVDSENHGNRFLFSTVSVLVPNAR